MSKLPLHKTEDGYVSNDGKFIGDFDRKTDAVVKAIKILSQTPMDT